MQVVVDLLHQRGLDPGQLRAGGLHPFQHPGERRPVQRGGGAAEGRGLQDDPGLVHVPQTGIGEGPHQPVRPFILRDEPAFMHAAQHVADDGAADVEMRRHERFAEAETAERSRRFNGALRLGRDAVAAAARDFLGVFAREGDVETGERRIGAHRHQRLSRRAGHDISAPLETLDAAFVVQPPERHLHRRAADPECVRDRTLEQNKAGRQAMLLQVQLQHLMHLLM